MIACVDQCADDGYADVLGYTWVLSSKTYAATDFLGLEVVFRGIIGEDTYTGRFNWEAWRTGIKFFGELYADGIADTFEEALKAVLDLWESSELALGPYDRRGYSVSRTCS